MFCHVARTMYGRPTRRLASVFDLLASESSGTSAIWEDGEVLEGTYAALVRDFTLLGAVLKLLLQASDLCTELCVLRLALRQKRAMYAAVTAAPTQMCVRVAASEGGDSVDRQICRKEGCYCKEL